MSETNEKKKILVVDDEDFLRQALSSKFEESGFEVLQAGDGEEGLRIALSEHPDLVILDIMMPKMDGMTTMKKLRADEWGKSVPLILLTSMNPDDSMLHDIMKSEPAYYLIKSEYSIDAIVEKAVQKLNA